MSKKYNAAETKAILKEVCDRSYSMIASGYNELAKLNLTPEEMMSLDFTDKRINTARYLSSLIVVLSDCLSPAFKISLQLCTEENRPFIDQVMAKYDKYVETEKEKRAAAAKREEEVKIMMEGEEGDRLP